MNHLITITKSDGTSQLFEEEKLIASLKRVGAKPEAIDEVVEEVEREMREGATTNEIYSRAFALLKKHSNTVAVKYSIRRALMELGPDGFPFEKLVARIFTMWGYETLTDQMLLGVCVPHEVDVVAWKGPSLAMVEAKYHNEIGTRSDLRVALYVKARYDDLSTNDYEYGSVQRKLAERWLVTNTKFTDRAITYGECQGMKLLGWNYPSQENLHDILLKNSLYPITCLNTLTKEEKRAIVSQGILVCMDLAPKQDVLKMIGFKDDHIASILAEAARIVEHAK